MCLLHNEVHVLALLTKDTNYRSDTADKHL